MVEPDAIQLQILIDRQQLVILNNNKVVAEYAVSTAINGAGELNGSGCTPRGWHKVRAKIGDDQPINSVFVGRRPTGEVFSEDLSRSYPNRDWILSRILWLTGAEPGFNRGGEHDTLRRYIYIHGTPDKEPMGIPQSHGCIRMRNEDVIELFDQVEVGTPVLIREHSF